MTVAGLFAGIGGLEVGFASAGFKTPLLADNDEDARAVLRARFPDVEIAGDVADLADLPEGTSIVTAGFPCQNLSMAGDKKGIGGEKSSVVSGLFRLIERSQVPTVVIENVYFMLQLDRGRAMDHIVSEFERLGYKWAYRILDTMGFGLPQRRRRVYLVASNEIDPTTVLFADETELPTAKPVTLDKPIGFYWTEGRSGVGVTSDGIPPLKGGSGVGIPSAPAVLFPDGAVLMPSLTGCERLQGFEPGWTKIERVTARRPPEWRLLGNAVSVPVATWLASRLINPGKMLEFPTHPIAEDARWPAAAFGRDGVRFAVKATDRPIAVPTPSIEAFRDESWKPLSDRALSGFVIRAKEGGLKFPPGFVDAIEQAIVAKIAA